MPELGIQTEEYNTHLRLSAPNGWNSFSTQDSIGLRFEVIGNESVAIDPRTGVFLYMLQDDQWIEVSNLTKYPGITESLIYQPAQGIESNKGSLGVRPVLTDYEQNITLRVVLIGYIVINGDVTSEEVAGYMDLSLKP